MSQILWAIQIAPTRIENLIEEDNIQSVEEGPAPIQPLNNLSRDRINVDQVQDIDLSTTPPTYYGLSGKGVNIAVSESVFTGHSDFGEYNSLGNLISSRFLNSHLSSGSQHGTHVAGIMGGNGWNSDGFGTPYQWRGMAPEVSLITSSSLGDSGYEKGQRVDASNHSYIGEHGTYSSSSHDVDADIHGKNGLDKKKPHIWAAANNGLYPGNWGVNEEGYYSISASGKNTIVVGAANANDGTLSKYSSLGPTFDGRIKPDVMAAGCKNPMPHGFPQHETIVHIDYIRILDGNDTQKSWEFDEQGNFEGWFDSEKANLSNESVSGGNLNFQGKIQDDNYVYVENVNISTNSNQVVEIKYRVENPNNPPFTLSSSLAWTRQGVDAYSLAGAIKNYIRIDDEYHTLTVPVGQDTAWPGSVGWLRLDIPEELRDRHPTKGIISTNTGGGYIAECGTSMAAPAVTGTVALMLQQFVEKHGIDLAVNPPLPSTIKAILIQTAEDMIHEKAYPRDAVNPDTGTPVLYYEGPDFATGYGLVNAKEAVDLIENSANKTLIRESKLDVDQNEIYSVYVTSSIAELKITLAWDDVEASTSLGDERISRLVNDLDLVLIDPNVIKLSCKQLIHLALL